MSDEGCYVDLKPRTTHIWYEDFFNDKRYEALQYLKESDVVIVETGDVDYIVNIRNAQHVEIRKDYIMFYMINEAIVILRNGVKVIA